MDDNMVTMVVIGTSGSIMERQVAIDNLSAFQKAVGGYIEIVPYCDLFEYKGTIHKCIALCDEEGKVKAKPFNKKATLLWNKGLKAKGIFQNPDFLVGDIAFIFGDPEIMEKF